MNDAYILAADGKTPIPEPDLIKWAKWFEHFPNRIVAQEMVGPFKISTVFLGFNHGFSFHETAQPILWETMIFGPPEHELDQSQERYSSYEAALEGHQKAVELVKGCYAA